MKPPIQFRNPSFTTPQRSIDTDFSSGPDQSSPLNADTEDTPEPPARTGVSKSSTAVVQFEGAKSDRKPQPSVGVFDNLASSGRGEILRKTYTDAVTRRVHKRRRRDADRNLRSAQRRGSFGSDSDSRSRPSSQEGPAPSQQRLPPREAGFIASIFTFIEKHPNLPHVLSYYAQFLLNFFLVLFMMYLVYSFWSTIRSDVDMKSREVASNTLAEMAACAREYKENRCELSSRVPAVETACNNWERCMQQDPSKIGRARVSAHTFAEILNSFIEPISVKTMVSLSYPPPFSNPPKNTKPNPHPIHPTTKNNPSLQKPPQISSFILIFGCFAISNITLSFFRHKIPPPPPPPSQAHSYMPPPSQMGYPNPAPPYPSHAAAPGLDHYYTPYQHRIIEPEQIGTRTPIRRLGYR